MDATWWQSYVTFSLVFESILNQFPPSYNFLSINELSVKLLKVIDSDFDWNPLISHVVDMEEKSFSTKI